MAELALVLAGQEMAPFTRDLLACIGRGEITGDQAVNAVIDHFVSGRAVGGRGGRYRR